MLHSLHRAMTLALLFGLLALTLAGCVHVDRSVQLHSDGSGTYTLNLGLSDKVVSSGGSTLRSQIEACGVTARSQGAGVRTYEQDGYAIWSFTWSFQNVNALNELLRTALQSCDTGGATVSVNGNGTDFFKVARRTSGFTTIFHVTGQMSFTLDQNVTSGSPEAQLLQDARETFAITMPGGITSYSGGVVSGNTITYTVHANETATIDATSRSLDVEALYPVIGGGVVVLLLFGAMVWVYRRRSLQPLDGQDAALNTDEGSIPAKSAPDTVSTASTAGYPHDAPTLPSQDEPPPVAP